MTTTNTLVEKLILENEAKKMFHSYLLVGSPEQTRRVVDDVLLNIQGGKVDPLDNFFCFDDDSKFGVEELRKIQNQMIISSNSPYKACYIENIERLSIPAINSILKILEEPPRQVLFFLSCKNLNNVLDTIISRCRTYEIARGDDYHEFDIRELLSGLQIENDAIEFANGLEDRKEALAIAEALLSYSREQVLDNKNEYADLCILTQRCIDDLNSNVNHRLALEVLLLRAMRLVSSM
jgi:DNA polymerase III gamma/tau subunit